MLRFWAPPALCDFSESAVRVLALAPSPRQKAPAVAGYGEAPAAGYRDGRFINLSDAAECVYAAAQAASRAAGYRIRSVFVNLDDPFLEGVESEGMTGLEKGTEGFAERHVAEAVSRARQSVRPSDKHLVYQGVSSYFIDGGDSLSDPIGVFGRELRVVVYLLYSDSEHAQNMKSLMMRAGLDLAAMHPSGIAAWKGVVPTAERQAGCTVVTAGPKVCHVVRAPAGAAQSYRSLLIVESYSARETDELARIIGRGETGDKTIFLTGEMSETDDLALALGQRLGRPILCAGAPFADPARQSGRYAVLAGLAQLKPAPRLKIPVRAVDSALDSALVRRITTKAKTFVQEYF